VATDAEREREIRERQKRDWSEALRLREQPDSAYYDIAFLLARIDDLTEALGRARKDTDRLDDFERFALENHGDGRFSTDIARVEGEPDADPDDPEAFYVTFNVCGPRIGRGTYATGEGRTFRAAIDSARSPLDGSEGPTHG
jgi:hypothetical protein